MFEERMGAMREQLNTQQEEFDRFITLSSCENDHYYIIK